MAGRAPPTCWDIVSADGDEGTLFTGTRRHERQGSPEKDKQEPFKGGAAATESS